MGLTKGAGSAEGTVAGQLEHRLEDVPEVVPAQTDFEPPVEPEVKESRKARKKRRSTGDIAMKKVLDEEEGAKEIVADTAVELDFAVPVGDSCELSFEMSPASLPLEYLGAIPETLSCDDSGAVSVSLGARESQDLPIAFVCDDHFVCVLAVDPTGVSTTFLSGVHGQLQSSAQPWCAWSEAGVIVSISESIRTSVRSIQMLDAEDGLTTGSAGEAPALFSNGPVDTGASGGGSAVPDKDGDVTSTDELVMYLDSVVVEDRCQLPTDGPSPDTGDVPAQEERIVGDESEEVVICQPGQISDGALPGVQTPDHIVLDEKLDCLADSNPEFLEIEDTPPGADCVAVVRLESSDAPSPATNLTQCASVTTYDAPLDDRLQRLEEILSKLSHQNAYLETRLGALEDQVKYLTGSAHRKVGLRAMLFTIPLLLAICMAASVYLR